MKHYVSLLHYTVASKHEINCEMIDPVLVITNSGQTFAAIGITTCASLSTNQRLSCGSSYVNKEMEKMMMMMSWLEHVVAFVQAGSFCMKET